ncbi:expressed unknown protein [Seminavis robusta]|uniref:SEA domain-containing protein n=1 Tax=Seminavis robusta TaxID=568900 RepID=A0A9N8EGA0_9STRA|nr:expressed unknown protein [Seminavis robusta]|eukprot:Sro893_g217060.3  (1557) ;mRNA; r:27991-32661
MAIIPACSWKASNALKLLAYLILIRSITGEARSIDEYTLGQQHHQNDETSSGVRRLGRERRLRRKAPPDRNVRKGPRSGYTNTKEKDDKQKRKGKKGKKGKNKKGDYSSSTISIEEEVAYDQHTQLPLETFPTLDPIDTAAEFHDVEEYVEQEFHYNKAAKKNDKAKYGADKLIPASKKHKGPHTKTKKRHGASNQEADTKDQRGPQTKTKHHHLDDYAFDQERDYGHDDAAGTVDEDRHKSDHTKRSKSKHHKGAHTKAPKATRATKAPKAEIDYKGDHTKHPKAGHHHKGDHTKNPTVHHHQEPYQSKSKSKKKGSHHKSKKHHTTEKHYHAPPKGAQPELGDNYFQSTILLVLDPDSPELSTTQSRILERAVLHSYNTLSNDLCDPFGRELSDARIVFVDNIHLLVHTIGECRYGCDTEDITLFSPPALSYFDSMPGSHGYVQAEWQRPQTPAPAYAPSSSRHSQSPNQIYWSTSKPVTPVAATTTTVPATATAADGAGRPSFHWDLGDQLDGLHSVEGASLTDPPTASPSVASPVDDPSTPVSASTNVPTSPNARSPTRKVPTLDDFRNVPFDLDGKHYRPRKPRSHQRQPKLRRSASSTNADTIGSIQNRELTGLEDDDDSIYANSRKGLFTGRRRLKSKSRKSKSGGKGNGAEGRNAGCTKHNSEKGGYDDSGCCSKEDAPFRAPTELEFTQALNQAISQMPDLRVGVRQQFSAFLEVAQTVEQTQIPCSTVEETFDSALLIQFVGEENRVTESQIREVEQAIKDTYLTLEATLCDIPYFRQLDDVRHRGTTAGDIPGTFVMEFLLRGTCRGSGCSQNLDFFSTESQRRLGEDNKLSSSSVSRGMQAQATCLCPVFSGQSGAPSIIDFTDQFAARIDELNANGALPSIQASLGVFEEDADFMIGLQRESFASYITVDIFGDADFVTMEEIDILERTLVEVYNDLQLAGFCDPLGRLCETATLTFFNPTPAQDSTFVLSFQVGASCLGEGCRETATLFSDGMRRNLQLGELEFPPECQPGQEPRAPTEQEFADVLNRRLQQLFQQGILQNVMGSGTVMEDKSLTLPPSEVMTFSPTVMPTFMDVATPDPTAATPPPTQAATTLSPTVAPTHMGDTSRPTVLPTAADNVGTMRPTTAASETEAPSGLRGTLAPTSSTSSGEVTMRPTTNVQTSEPSVETTATGVPSAAAANETQTPTVGNGTATLSPTALNQTSTVTPTLSNVSTEAPTILMLNMTTLQPSLGSNATNTSFPTIITANTSAPTIARGNTSFPTIEPAAGTPMMNTTAPTTNVTIAPSNQTLAPSNQTQVPSMDNATMLPIGNETLVPSQNMTIFPNQTLAPSQNMTIFPNQTIAPTTNVSLPPQANTTAPTANNTIAPSNQTQFPTAIGNATLPPIGNETLVPSQNMTIFPNQTLAPSQNMTIFPNQTIAPTTNVSLPPQANTTAPTANNTIAPSNQTQFPTAIGNATLPPTGNETLVPSQNMTILPNQTLTPSQNMTIFPNQTIAPTTNVSLPPQANTTAPTANNTIAPSIKLNSQQPLAMQHYLPLEMKL